MNWKARTALVVVAMAVMLVGVPLLSGPKTLLWAFLLFIVCVLTISIALAPILSQYGASMFIDFIYSTNGTTAETDINDPVIYEQSQNVFSLLRTCCCLALAAGLYGIFWATPILLNWPSMQDLKEIPRNLVAACIVGGLSALEWIFYFAFYFIPEVWNRLRTCWVNWRVRREQSQ